MRGRRPCETQDSQRWGDSGLLRQRDTPHHTAQRPRHKGPPNSTSAGPRRVHFQSLAGSSPTPRLWPPWAAGHLYISGGSRPPYSASTVFRADERAWGVTAGRLTGCTALSPHLRPQPLFLDDRVRRTQTEASQAPRTPVPLGPGSTCPHISHHFKCRARPTAWFCRVHGFRQTRNLWRARTACHCFLTAGGTDTDPVTRENRRGRRTENRSLRTSGEA